MDSNTAALNQYEHSQDNLNLNELMETGWWVEQKNLHKAKILKSEDGLAVIHDAIPKELNDVEVDFIRDNLINYFEIGPNAIKTEFYLYFAQPIALVGDFLDDQADVWVSDNVHYLLRRGE